MDEQRKERVEMKIWQNRYHFDNIWLHKILSKIDEIPNLEIYQKYNLLWYITETFMWIKHRCLWTKESWDAWDEVSDFIEDNPDLDEDQYEELYNALTVEKVTDTISNHLNHSIIKGFEDISEHPWDNTNFKGSCEFIPVELDENFKPLEEITKDEDIKQSFTWSPEKILSIIEKILQNVLTDFKNKDHESFKQHHFIKSILDNYMSSFDLKTDLLNNSDKNSIKLIRGLTSIDALNLYLSLREYRIAFKKKANIFRAIEIIRATIEKHCDDIDIREPIFGIYPKGKMTEELFLKIVSALDSKESEWNKNKNSVKTKKNDKEVTF